jgi:formate hydrogenlyase subunit 3/multisubunit Na+/H+ antiporter MnhD subunit
MLALFNLGGVEILLILGLALLSVVFWIWMLIHAIQNRGLTDTEKIIWVLVIALLHAVGALIYFFVGRPKATGQPRVPPADDLDPLPRCASSKPSSTPITAR